MRKVKNITISTADRDLLLKLIASVRLDSRIAADHIAALEGELIRASVIAPADLPPDVISMNSTVWYRDLDANEVECYTLVTPREADVKLDRISVLAPIGTALLGYRVGDIVHWQVPQGNRRLEIIKVSNPASVSKAEEELLPS